ncbi:MAG: phage tail protein [Candidatus Didemnitutus sp.]|nr:phage tail protein [Candidatus Didemnitutus sp.]
MPAALPFIMWAGSATIGANLFLFAFKIISYAIVGLVISKAFSKKPSAALNQTSPLQMTKEPTPIRRVIYGETRVSGPMIYAAVGGAKNEFLHLVLPLATHECEALGLLYFNDRTVDIGESGEATDGLAGFARVKKHLGAHDQAADADLIAESAGAWTTNDRVAGSAYLYVRLKWDQNKFPSGIPNVSCVARGRKLYDPRTEESAWSTNVALCVRDYLVNTTYGLGVDESEIDEASFIASANICDETVTLAGGGTEKRYTCNGAFELSAEPGNVLEKLAAAMAGWVVYVGGKWICQAGAHDTPTITLDEDDLRAPLTVQTKLSLRDTCNLVKGTFTSPAEQYQPADFPAVTSSVYQAEDQGREIVRDLDLLFTASPSMAQRLAKIELQRTRRDTTVTMPCKLTALRVRAGSTVMVSHARYGWAEKQFVVMSHKFITYGEGSLGVDLLLRETDSAIYTWSDEEENPYLVGDETNLDWHTVPPPAGITLSTANVAQPDGVIAPRLKVIWAAPDNQFVLAGGAVQIEYKRTADAAWLIAAAALRGDATLAYIADVRGGDSIDVRLRFANSHGRTGLYSDVATATVSLDTTAPDAPAISAATPAPGGITLVWGAVADDDLSYYRIYRRLAAEADDITGAILVWAGLATSWTDFTVLIGPSYRYWIRAIDTSGNVSAASNSASAAADPATGHFIDYRFKRATSAPDTPEGDEPSGWNDAPPSGADPLWMSKAQKTAAGVLVGAWSAPIRLTGSDGEAGDSLEVEYSIDGSTSWHFPFASADKYMRQRIGGGAWSLAIKILGEDGETGPAGPAGTTPQASEPTITSLASPSLRISAPGGAEAGWYVAYTIGGGGTQYLATSFPVDVNPGSPSVKLWVTGRAPGYTDSVAFDASWNDLNE